MQFIEGKKKKTGGTKMSLSNIRNAYKFCERYTHTGRSL